MSQTAPFSIDDAVGKGMHRLQRSLPSIEFAEYRHWERSRLVAGHSHAALFQLDYFPEGQGTYRIQGKTLTIKSDQLFFVAPGQSHEIKSSAARPLVNLTIKFRHPYLSSCFLPAVMKIPLTLIGQIVKLIREVVAKTVTDTAENKYIASLRLAELLASLYQTYRDAQLAKASNPIVLQVIRHMLVHYQEPLTLAHLAQAGNISGEHLCRVFKKETGVSPFEFLQLLRLEQAKTRLGDDRGNISDIAAMVGFGKSSDMNRCFRKHLGVSPRKYRLNLKYSGR